MNVKNERDLKNKLNNIAIMKRVMVFIMDNRFFRSLLNETRETHIMSFTINHCHDSVFRYYIHERVPGA